MRNSDRDIWLSALDARLAMTIGPMAAVLWKALMKSSDTPPKKLGLSVYFSSQLLKIDGQLGPSKEMKVPTQVGMKTETEQVDWSFVRPEHVGAKSRSNIWEEVDIMKRTFDLTCGS